MLNYLPLWRARATGPQGGGGARGQHVGLPRREPLRGVGRGANMDCEGKGERCVPVGNHAPRGVALRGPHQQQIHLRGGRAPRVSGAGRRLLKKSLKKSK